MSIDEIELRSYHGKRYYLWFTDFEVYWHLIETISAAIEEEQVTRSRVSPKDNRLNCRIVFQVFSVINYKYSASLLIHDSVHSDKFAVRKSHRPITSEMGVWSRIQSGTAPSLPLLSNASRWEVCVVIFRGKVEFNWIQSIITDRLNIIFANTKYSSLNVIHAALLIGQETKLLRYGEIGHMFIHGTEEKTTRKKEQTTITERKKVFCHVLGNSRTPMAGYVTGFRSWKFASSSLKWEQELDAPRRNAHWVTYISKENVKRL